MRQASPSPQPSNLGVRDRLLATSTSHWDDLHGIKRYNRDVVARNANDAKLKTYQTSLGFYDLAIAAPSIPGRRTRCLGRLRDNPMRVRPPSQSARPSATTPIWHALDACYPW
jgi:hypothetical protein